MGAEFEVQKALYTALNGDGTVSGLVNAVYDFAPQVSDGGSGGAFPYIEVGTILFNEMDTKTRNGFDFACRIHTRSRSNSAKETKDIQSAIYDVLHLQGLSVTGYNTILMRRETSDVMRAPDGSFHGVCEYRGLIDKT